MTDLNAKRKFCADPPPAASSATGPGRAFGGSLLLSLAVCAGPAAAGAAAQTAPSYTIDTFAGGGLGGGGDGGPAVQARVSPLCVTADVAGNLYIVNSHSTTNLRGRNGRIRKVDATTGIISTVVGNGERALSLEYVADGEPATTARLINPSCPVIDAAGNLYFSDNFRIRKVDAVTGIISTVAGNGRRARSHQLAEDGVPATAASLYFPRSLAIDASNNLYFTGYQNVRKVDAATGLISTVAGNGEEGYSGDGGAATEARLSLWSYLHNFHGDLAIDAAGNLYIADLGNRRIRKVDAATGIISTVAGNGTNARSNRRPGASDEDPFVGTEEGKPATQAAINYPLSISVDAAGNLFILSDRNASFRFIQKVDAITGAISMVAAGQHKLLFGPCLSIGDGGPSVTARVCYPRGIDVDAAGNLYIADLGNNRIRKVDAATGIISTVAGNGEDGYGSPGGAVFVPATRTTRAHYAYPEESELTATEAQFDVPYGLAVDAAGNLHISDKSTGRFRKVDAATGIVTTIRGYPLVEYGYVRIEHIALRADGSIYYTYDRFIESIQLWKPSDEFDTVLSGGGNYGTDAEDGAPLREAAFRKPSGVAVDSSGNLYIADSWGNRVFKADFATGIISTVAGMLGESGYSGDGGPALEARLGSPYHLAIDAADNLYIDSRTCSCIRKVDAATGIISTVAGNGILGYSGDGGPAQEAQLGKVFGMAVDAAGNIFISTILTAPYTRSDYAGLYHTPDTAYAIRRVDAVTGNIATVAGGNGLGYSGDGGPALEAQFHSLAGLAVDSWGNVYIADAGNGRIRRLTPRQSGNAPAISSNGFALATGTPVVERIAPNALISVFGQEFAAAGTRASSPALDAAGRVAGNLADTCLEIGGSGSRVPLFYVSPTQINAQAPSGLPSGRTQARVVRNCGKDNELPGATAAVAVAAVSPALFNLGGNADGRNPLVALHSGGPALVGPPELGAAFTPAEPGEVVTLFGTGFGTTEPALATGEIPGAAVPLAYDVSFSIGGFAVPPEDILYRGAAPCCAGLYQFTLRVPVYTSDGNAPVTAVVQGASTPSGPFLTIQRR